MCNQYLGEYLGGCGDGFVGVRVLAEVLDAAARGQLTLPAAAAHTVAVQFHFLQHKHNQFSNTAQHYYLGAAFRLLYIS